MNKEFSKYLLEGQQAGAQYAITIPNNLRTLLAGSYISSNAGSSLEFRDYRQYAPGDDLRHIDWNVYARSDTLTTKLYCEEVVPHVDIIIDGSASMNLNDTGKGHATLGMAALIAQAARNCGLTHSAWLAGNICEKITNSSEEPVLWDGIDLTSKISCELSLKSSHPVMRPGGIRVLISDLFWMGDPLNTLNIISEKASSVYVIQVLANADANPDLSGNTRLKDCETGDLKEMLINAESKEKYISNLNKHKQNWTHSCRQVGAKIATVIAERVLENWELDELIINQMVYPV